MRRSVLLDLYTSEDSHDGKSLAAYRKGNYKLIIGSYKDSHWYTEPDKDCVKSTDNGVLKMILESVARVMDLVFGEGPCDNLRMLIFNLWLFNHYSSNTDPDQPLLFNIADDPEERFNLAEKMPSVVEDLMREVKLIQDKRPRHPR